MKNRQKIPLKLRTKVLKFLSHHLQKEGDVLLVNMNSMYSLFIRSRIMIAPRKYKRPTDYNCEISVSERKGPVASVARYRTLYIPERHQEEINLYFSKFINHMFCLEAIHLHNKKKVGEVKNHAEEFCKRYGFTEEELTIESLLKAFQRFKNKALESISEPISI